MKMGINPVFIRVPFTYHQATMGRLTTHVLDTAHGKPGRDVEIHLYKIVDNSRVALSSKRSNADGRCDTPLLEGETFQSGVYELDFHVGDYFRTLGVVQTQPPFLDVVTLRFGVNDASQHYHVPLVVTPWSYATYRGS
jgi:5-hydroxyisourate hydrolase